MAGKSQRPDAALFAAFDHDSQGPLDALARGERIASVKKPADSGTEREERAIGSLLSTGAEVLLVHAHDKAWKHLLVRLNNQVAVRFSTVAFKPRPPERAGRGGFYCCKALGQMNAQDFEKMLTVLSDEQAVAGMLQGIIPRSVSHLFAYRSPHRLTALYILVQGVLATAASDPANARNSEIVQCLGIGSVPPVPTPDISRLSTIWKVLGMEVAKSKVTSDAAKLLHEDVAAELGINDWNFKSNKDTEPEAAIRKLLAAICTGTAGDRLNEDIALAAFKAMRKTLENK